MQYVNYGLLLYGTVLLANNAKNSEYRASVATKLMVEMLLALFFLCNAVYQVEQSKSGTVPAQ